MDQSWSNHGTNIYLQTCNYNLNNHLMNNGWGFKPRAYVNPKIVNCSFPFSNINNVTIPKKIHINPNFKRDCSQGAIVKPKIETGIVHINPHFCQANVNFVKASEHFTDNSMVKPSLSQEEKIKVELSNLDVEKNEHPSEKELYKYKTSRKFQLSTNATNSTYFWSKNNASVPVSQSKSEAGTLAVAQTTRSTSRNIKTRHKIVHGVSSDTNKVYKTVNSKPKIKNPYKIINVEKSRLNTCSKPKSYYSLKKRNLSVYSKTNVGKKDNILDTKRYVKNLTTKKVSNFNKTYVNKITNSIRTKYIYQNKILNRRKLKLLNVGNYKLDAVSAKNDYDNQDSFSKNKSLKRVILTWKSVLSKSNKFRTTNCLIWRKQSRSEKDLKRMAKSYPNKTVVNIGGIMYKSSTNKLTRTKDKKQAVQFQLLNLKPIVTTCKSNQIVYVRGEKFLLGEGGKTLIRQHTQDNVNKSTVRRVDIGGVTYIQKSNNLLIQTKTHQARHFVNYAKQKSIALLSSLHKRNNMPCMIYQKFGVCRRHNKGMCIYVHDPKNVALCKKFLKGECSDSVCLLSHNVVDEKIATCHFFLRGNCSRENCPFLHVKVNNKAAICRDFLQGFCSLGQNCTKRHIHQCPDFDEKEACSRGNKCPYPHKVAKRKTKNYKVTKFKFTKKVEVNTEENIKTKKTKKCKAKKRKMKKEKSSPQEGCNDSTVECIPKRVKLDDLPLFIPLNT